MKQGKAFGAGQGGTRHSGQGEQQEVVLSCALAAALACVQRPRAGRRIKIWGTGPGQLNALHGGGGQLAAVAKCGKAL